MGAVLYCRYVTHILSAGSLESVKRHRTTKYEVGQEVGTLISIRAEIYQLCKYLNKSNINY